MDQEFQIEERADAAPPVIAVSGEIDVATAPQLRECLHRVIAQGESTIVLDLLGVTFLDSTALGVLVGRAQAVPRSWAATCTSSWRTRGS